LAFCRYDTACFLQSDYLPMSPRFYYPQPLPQENLPVSITLDDAAAAHMRVLRLSAGDAVTLFNGMADGEATAVITHVEKRTITLEIQVWTAISRESPRHITLVQGLATGDKMDLIVQKATELGVAAIVPIACARSTIKLDGERADKRVAHWQGVAIAACEQCGRNRVPRVFPIQTFNESLETAGSLGIFHPKTPANAGLLNFSHMREWSESPGLQGSPLVIMVGPEGGFTDAEVALAHARGATCLTLGARVLRTETAGLAALAVLQALAGDLG
jgi:16S rRNA (uracil1498-N3)-methyltransferase